MILETIHSEFDYSVNGSGSLEMDSCLGIPRIEALAIFRRMKCIRAEASTSKTSIHDAAISALIERGQDKSLADKVREAFLIFEETEEDYDRSLVFAIKAMMQRVGFNSQNVLAAISDIHDLKLRRELLDLRKKLLEEGGSNLLDVPENSKVDA